MDDEGGVLGNLPRSRPGQRSEKRSAPATGAPKPRRSTSSRAKAAKPTAKPKPRRARPTATAEPPPPVHESATSARAGAVGGVVRIVSSLAGNSTRVAGGVAREVLRRLPRP